MRRIRFTTAAMRWRDCGVLMVGEPAVWPDPDPGWRVRTGAGLLAHTPMSDERREAFRREEERERLQAERDAEMREQARVERVGELLMQGHTPKTQAELFQQVSFAQDRQDAVDRHREEQAAELAGKPRPTYVALLREARVERETRQAAAEETPVSQAEFGRVVSKLKTTIENTFGKRLLK